MVHVECALIGKAPPMLAAAAGSCARSHRTCWARGMGSSSRREERKELFEEIKRGYFADFHEFRRTRGKRSEAADTLCSRGEAVAFPSLSGRSLTGSTLELPAAARGAPSIVLFSMRAFGMRMCNLYRRPFEEAFGSHGKAKVFEVSLVERTFFRWMRKWMEKNLRREIPTDRHQSFMVYTGDAGGEVRRALQLGNSIVAHAFLVDGSGMVRWRAHALPTERELGAMIRCARQLMSKK